MKNVLILLCVLIVFTGCSFIKQGVDDYKLGKTTPLTNGEVSPTEQAQPIVTTVSQIPYVGPFAGLLSILLVGFFTYQRGKNIRKNNGNVVPVMPGEHTVVTGLIQDAANLAAGFFSTKSDVDMTNTGTVVQRVWKVALSTIAGAATIAIAEPSFQAFLLSHPLVMAFLVAIPSLIAGIEKALSNVPPVVTVNPTTAATTVIS